MDPRFRKDFFLTMPFQSAGAAWLAFCFSHPNSYQFLAMGGILMPMAIVVVWLCDRPIREIIMVILFVFPACAGNILLSFGAGKLAMLWMERR
ncbi:MAG: hypothetical protein J0M04_11390 [Verrucomicrobia bacterium]|nr:hypothetical protein [Verrucomicrobiota bacterium]